MALIDKISKNVKRLKGKRTFVDLAAKSGVPYRTLEKIIFSKEIKEPKISTLLKIARSLNTTIDNLIK